MFIVEFLHENRAKEGHSQLYKKQFQIYSNKIMLIYVEHIIKQNVKSHIAYNSETLTVSSINSIIQIL